MSKRQTYLDSHDHDDLQPRQAPPLVEDPVDPVAPEDTLDLLAHGQAQCQQADGFFADRLLKDAIDPDRDLIEPDLTVAPLGFPPPQEPPDDPLDLDRFLPDNSFTKQRCKEGGQIELAVSLQEQ